MVALLEAALNLMISKSGVYPLDMVTALRDQRPKLIQNFPLFNFACESIIFLYSEFFKYCRFIVSSFFLTNYVYRIGNNIPIYMTSESESKACLVSGVA